MEKYRRRNFLINSDFQIRYCVYVCSWLFTLSIVYPWIIYEVFDFFIRYLALRAPKVSPDDLAAVRTQLLWLLGTLQLVFLVVTALISIFVSHRIAGPLHKLKTWMEAGKAGKLKGGLLFRKSDYFKDLASDYNEMVQGVSRPIEKSIAQLEKALKGASGETQKQIEEALKNLRSIRDASVEGDVVREQTA